VHTTFNALTKEDNPFKCKEIIKKSIHKFSFVDKGGYKVQPTPAPPKFGSSAPDANCNVE
jgi:hypothetical protein